MCLPMIPTLFSASPERAEGADALCLLVPTPAEAHLGALPAPVADAVRAAIAVDQALARGKRPPVVLAAPGAPGGRVVLATLGALADETDDVRGFAEAAQAAVARAVEAGARRPLVHAVVPAGPRFARAREVAALGALSGQWVPLEAREAERAPATAERIGVSGLDRAALDRVTGLEVGRLLARDLTGTEPERMAPLRAAELCEKAFAGTPVKVSVETDVSGYPLLAAVARASMAVPRHRPCVVRLEYAPSGKVQRTLLLAGKGVTYDTGGADLKTEGHMAGMSRDKGGAGAVAGLVRAMAELAVPGVRVVGLLGLVRNSIGEECFVSDEIIRARSGCRVRIGNTDAEGRLVLADLLARLGEDAAGEPDPALFSVATLTGHAYRAYGPYTALVPNLAARERGLVARLAELGEAWGEPAEISRPRREDYAFIAAKTAAEDVVSCNRQASVNTPRGHQFPFAFLELASGLRTLPGALPYIHVDIAGSAVEGADWQFGRPTGAPVLSLAALASG